jgi:hypothetical protein
MGYGRSGIDQNMATERCMRGDRCQAEHHGAVADADMAADPGTAVDNRRETGADKVLQFGRHAGPRNGIAHCDHEPN